MNNTINLPSHIFTFLIVALLCNRVRSVEVLNRGWTQKIELDPNNSIIIIESEIYSHVHIPLLSNVAP